MPPAEVSYRLIPNYDGRDQQSGAAQCKYTIFSDAIGESHICDLEVEWTHNGPTGKTCDPVRVLSTSFQVTDGSHNLEWHNAPRRQYIVNLEGSVEITTSDGERRIIGPGEIIWPRTLQDE